MYANLTTIGNERMVLYKPSGLRSSLSIECVSRNLDHIQLSY